MNLHLHWQLGNCEILDGQMVKWTRSKAFGATLLPLGSPEKSNSEAGFAKWEMDAWFAADGQRRTDQFIVLWTMLRNVVHSSESDGITGTSLLMANTQ
jgi:hypothetical protein